MAGFGAGSNFHDGSAFARPDAPASKGMESTFRLASEAMFDLAAVSQIRDGEHGHTSANPEIARMLSGFSIAGADGTPAAGGLAGLDSFAKNDGAQMAAGVLSSIFKGLGDVGASFASQDQPRPDDQVAAQQQQTDQTRQAQEYQQQQQQQANYEREQNQANA